MRRVLSEEFDDDYESCSFIEQFVRDNVPRKFRSSMEKHEELRCDSIDAVVFAHDYACGMA